MPYKEHMGWDHSKRRWHKMYKGSMYRLPASQLGGNPTREATREAANEWWLRKKAALDGPQQKDETEAFVDSVLDGPPEGSSPLAFEIADELMGGIVAVPTYKKALEALEVGLSRPAKITERSVEANAQSFLNIVRGDMKPLSFRELRNYVQSLYADSGPLKSDDDVEIIHEGLVEKVYLQLRNGPLSSGVKKKRWGFFRRFVRYLWEKRLIDLPRNLDSHSFEVKAKKIKTFSIAEVRTCLDSLKPRLKLYALLGLNCGMTSADIGQLTKDMMDLDRSILTRKRVKTADNDSVPTVTYRLWPETVELLRECWSDDPVLALTSMEGTPLWRSSFDGDKTPQVDLIYQQYKRAGVTINVKHFRSIAATLIERHETYGRYVSHFLGHSPKSIKDRHYAAPSQELFDEALDWLQGRLYNTE